YAGTRHNVGWMVVDQLADRAGWSGGRERDAAKVVWGRYAGLDLTLVKPLTFMNDSGVAVRKALARGRTPLEDLLVVCDDFALPFGRLRLREAGSAGGHNGLRSIIGELGSQKFARLRVGIGAPEQAAIDHVLSRFTAEEQAALPQVVEAAADAVEAWAREGPARAANRWNTWRLDGEAGEGDGTSGSGSASGSGPASGSGAASGPAPASGSGGKTGSAAGSGGSGSSSDGTGSGTTPGDGIVRTRTGWRKLLGGER
ncbi:MAG TPA: aminoacyl-tRNA hydrolase, partial [Candidatus Limnocylindrales bacterium]|nr:aminoacyl-tRNA hydrolase [Candidatus Limnocylindrales bacterium]